MKAMVSPYFFFVLLLLFPLFLRARLSGSSGYRERGEETEFCDKFIRVLNYKCDEYFAITEDGFVLSIQRVGSDNNNIELRDNNIGNRLPVLLDHAMFLGGDAWINLLPNKANDKNLPLLLARYGFDVWIINHRGTRYSYNHVLYNATDRGFWDWSFDELAHFDLPVVFHLIQGETKIEKLHFVGFNQGGMLPLILASTMPKLFSRAVASLVLIAPAVYFVNPTSPTLRNWANLAPDQLIYRYNIESGQFNFTVVLRFLSYFSNAGIQLNRLVTVGYTADEMITNVTGPYCCLDNPPSVALEKLDRNWVVGSYRNLAHYQQEMHTLRFQAWDHGDTPSNTLAYSSSTPPLYYPSRVPDATPVMVVSGGNDWFSNVNNTNTLLSQLGGQVQHLFLPKYSHLDLIYSKFIEEDLCRPIAKFLQGD